MSLQGKPSPACFLRSCHPARSAVFYCAHAPIPAAAVLFALERGASHFVSRQGKLSPGCFFAFLRPRAGRLLFALTHPYRPPHFLRPRTPYRTPPLSHSLRRAAPADPLSFCAPNFAATCFVASRNAASPHGPLSRILRLNFHRDTIRVSAGDAALAAFLRRAARPVCHSFCVKILPLHLPRLIGKAAPRMQIVVSVLSAAHPGSLGRPLRGSRGCPTFCTRTALHPDAAPSPLLLRPNFIATRFVTPRRPLPQKQRASRATPRNPGLPCRDCPMPAKPLPARASGPAPSAQSSAAPCPRPGPARPRR